MAIFSLLLYILDLLPMCYHPYQCGECEVFEFRL